MLLEATYPHDQIGQETWQTQYGSGTGSGGRNAR